MATITYDILDESFFTKSSYVYHLHLVLADVACTYLIFDDEQLLAYRSYQLEQQNRELFSWKDELQTLMHQDKMLQLSFKTVKIMLLHQQFTLIPTTLFEAQNAAAYLNNVVPNTESDLVETDDLLKFNIKNVYALKIDLQSFIKENYPTASITHALSFLLENIQKESRFGLKLFLNFHHKQVQFLLFDGEKFNFANNFDFQTANDVAYFLMLVINQLSLNPETISVVLSGHIEKNTEVYNTIFRYVRNLSFLDCSTKKMKQKAFQETPNHLFINIL